MRDDKKECFPFQGLIRQEGGSESAGFHNFRVIAVRITGAEAGTGGGVRAGVQAVIGAGVGVRAGAQSVIRAGIEAGRGAGV